MSREIELEQKLEILHQHPAVATLVLETLILKLNHDGAFSAASLLTEIQAMTSNPRAREASPHWRQLMNQFGDQLLRADGWIPPSQRPETQQP